MSPLIVALLVHLEPLAVAIVQSLMPSKSLLIRLQDDKQVRPPVRTDEVVSVGVMRVEVVHID